MSASHMVTIPHYDALQGRRVPEGLRRVLLQVAARHSEAVFDVVRAKTP